MKIEGKGFSDFVDEDLAPYLFKRVESLASEIAEFDRAVIESLGPKSVKRGTLRSKLALRLFSPVVNAITLPNQWHLSVNIN